MALGRRVDAIILTGIVTDEETRRAAAGSVGDGDRDLGPAGRSDRRRDRLFAPRGGRGDGAVPPFARLSPAASGRAALDALATAGERIRATLDGRWRHRARPGSKSTCPATSARAGSASARSADLPEQPDVVDVRLRLDRPGADRRGACRGHTRAGPARGHRLRQFAHGRRHAADDHLGRHRRRPDRARGDACPARARQRARRSSGGSTSGSGSSPAKAHDLGSRLRDRL